MKNYSFFKYCVGGAALHVRYFFGSIGDWVIEHIKTAYHTIRGSWYCHYCGKSHPRRRAKFAMRIATSTITVDKLKWGQETTKPCICHKGSAALIKGTWRPETTSMSDAFGDIIKAFEGLAKAFSQSGAPASSKTVARHVYDPNNPSAEWEPHIWFKCDPLRNDSCTKETCRLNLMFSPEVSACERTSKPECSVDGKVLWPDKEFFEGTVRTRDTTSHICKHCPMDPAECKTYDKRPCDTTETYTDFITEELGRFGQNQGNCHQRGRR